jgi:hypothetical protein
MGSHLLPEEKTAICRKNQLVLNTIWKDGNFLYIWVKKEFGKIMVIVL